MDETYQTIVIGGGQAGLAAGYFLARRGMRFTILDEKARTGQSWRERWDSLRLFTPAKFSGLPGLPFPGPDFYFPTKDEAAAYLETYAGRFNLPVQHNIQVRALARSNGGFRVSTGAGSLAASQVIVATGAYQKPRTPAFSRELDPAILQMHSSAYRNTAQIPVQNVLVVGAGNSGAEIALELARAGKRVWLAGRDVGRIPADKFGRVLGGRPYWWFISRFLSLDTPIGRKMSSNVLWQGTPLINLSRSQVLAAGVEGTPRVTGAQSGLPRLEDGRSLPVEALIWATGFHPDYTWIDLPVFDEQGYPRHRRGIVPKAPGLFFVGLHFQNALSSALLGGVGTEAGHIVEQMG
jgi:putative flavoprotein involved in K+ transport